MCGPVRSSCHTEGQEDSPQDLLFSPQVRGVLSWAAALELWASVYIVSELAQYC